MAILVLKAYLLLTLVMIHKFDIFFCPLNYKVLKSRVLTSRELGLQLSNLSKTIRLSENFFSCSSPDVKTKCSCKDNIDNSALTAKRRRASNGEQIGKGKIKVC